MSFNELNSRIDKNQASLKEQTRLSEDPSKALDAFQARLNSPEIPEKLKEAQLKRLNTLLDSETQNTLENLDQDLAQYLDRFERSLTIFENKSLQKVEAGNTLGGFVKQKLGATWNHNPALFFTGVKVLQEYRASHGSQLQVNEDGSFAWNKGSASPDILEPGEYLDLSVLNNLSPQAEAIDFYLANTTQPQRKAAIERIKRTLTEQAAVPEMAQNAEAGATGQQAVQQEVEASINQGAGGEGFEGAGEASELPNAVAPPTAQELAVLKTQEALDLKGAHNTYVSESEDSKNYPASENIGYIPYLEAALVAARDDNEWTWDSQAEADEEKAELEKVSTAVSANLDQAQSALDACNPELNPTDYEALRKLFVENSKRYTELLASVDENLENVELRNLDKTIEQAEKTLAYMTTAETVEWTRSIMAQIDQNDWKSEGLSEVYGRLTDTLKAAVEAKLDADRQNMEAHPENTQAVSDYFKNTMTLARLFSDRGMDIDSGLTDSGFAVRMAKEAFDFNNLALRFAEKEIGKTPIKAYLEKGVPIALGKINALQVANDPEIVELKNKLQKPTNSIASLTQVYSCLRSVEEQLAGDDLDPKVCETELHNGLGQPIDVAMAHFGDFLNGNLFGGQNIDTINAAIGEPKLSFQQVEAWDLLADMEGYGYGLSDESWEYVAAGAKIAGMIAAGIAVGVATGGLGLVGAAVAGGATMTAIGVAAEGRGFDNFTDAGKTYGKDLAINTATMGAARYLAAGRTVFQLSRAGTLAEKGGAAAILKMAGQKGGSLALNSLDDAATLGTRLTGATLEGSADVLTGASLDTLIKGGEFTDNLAQNAMFFGLSYAEFAGPGLKTLKGMSAEKLQSVRQLSSSISLERFKVDTLLKGSKWTAETLCTQLKKLDPRERLSFIATEFRTLASKARAELADRMASLIKKGEELGESLTPLNKITREFVLGDHTNEGLSSTAVEGSLPDGSHIIAASDRGIGYSAHNEDRVVVNGNRIVVIDGMGGMGKEGDGGKAAAIGAEEFKKEGPIQDAVERSKAAIYNDPSINNEAGFVFVSAEIQSRPSGRGKRLEVSSVGDAVLIVVKKDGRIAYASQQDSEVEILLKAGILTRAQARNHRRRAVVTKSVSGDKMPTLHKEHIDVEPGDRVYMYSDGIGDNLFPEEIVRETRALKPAEAMQHLDTITATRMQDIDTITDVPSENKYSDGFESQPKKDNRGLVIIDIK